MDDLISRQAVIDVEGIDEQIRCEMCENPMHTDRGCDGNCKYDEKLYKRIMQILGERIKPLPSAQPEVKEIGYAECANAMLKMWIDNVLTDGEYCTMWYERYFRQGHVFQLHDPEDEEDLNTYIKSLMEQGVNYKKVFFTTGCGEEFVCIET